MPEESRVQNIGERAVNAKGRYVLYWMQASQRTRFNPALEYAIHAANQLKLPVRVCFGLMSHYPEATARHYAFMLQGLDDVRAGLEPRGIAFDLRRGEPATIALKLARHAAMVVCDRGYLRHQKRWRDEVADGAKCRVVQVEGDVVVPVEVVSDKAEFAARTIRPKIHKHWDEYLKPLRATRVGTRVASPAFRIPVWSDASKSKRFSGGETQARLLLREFISKRLPGYDLRRNEPSLGHTSTLSPYLHFGQISPVEIALAAKAAHVPSFDREAFLEELIVRRELAMNFANFTPDYDRYECLPAWARKTLKQHARDRRETIYSLKQLESAETHDSYWNAAQAEMTRTGFMHNYMRMYWGKKILEWTRSPKQAYETTLYLNNKYFLDGRDPVSFANVAWIYGLHDRPWGPARKIFGTVRYMNSAGLDRKFNMDAYVKWVDSLGA